MVRLTTRVKRKKNLGSTSQRHRFWKGNTESRKRMKSFSTEDLARGWAKTQKLDEKSNKLRQLPSGKWQWRKLRKTVAQ